VDTEPLLEVTGDQSGLPACDKGDAAGSVKSLVENSPMGQTMHIAVLRVGKITSRQIKEGMSICTTSMMTNGGEMSFQFQYYRKDGDVYVYGKPVID